MPKPNSRTTATRLNSGEFSYRNCRWLIPGFCLSVALAITGCQSNINGQTSPSGYLQKDDVQYPPAGPEFKLSREAAAMKAYQDEVAKAGQKRTWPSGDLVGSGPTGSTPNEHAHVH